MTAGAPNPFAVLQEASWSSRAFDGAKILFVRHVLIVGVIPEEVATGGPRPNPTLIFSIIHDPPGGARPLRSSKARPFRRPWPLRAHAAELATSSDFGVDVGWEADLQTGVT